MGCQRGRVTNRLILSLLLFTGSLGITAICWALGFPFFLIFLFVPLIPLLRWEPEKRYCPICGWETAGDEKYRPYDGVFLTIREKKTNYLEWERLLPIYFQMF